MTVLAAPVAASEPEVAPCVYTNSLAVSPVPSSAPWQRDVHVYPIDDDRVFWYSTNDTKDGSVDPILLVVQDCSAGTDVVIYPWTEDPSLSVSAATDVLFRDGSIGTEELIDALAVIGSNSWTRNAVTGNCVCEHHLMDTEQS